MPRLVEKMLNENEKNCNQMEAATPNVSSASGAVCSKKIRPRAIVFKANHEDFDKIRELIGTQFPAVEIVYITTGPSACILHVTKSMPFEMQNSPEQLLYTIE